MATPLFKKEKGADAVIFVLCAALSVLSVVTLLSVAMYGGLRLSGRFGEWKPALTQAAAASLGAAGALALARADHRVLMRRWPWHAGLCWGLVLLTFVPGVGYAPGGTGSRSWIGLPGGFSFQPSEFAKISFILTLAAHLNCVYPALNRPKTVAPVLLHLALPALLLHLQGDDGAAFSFLAIGLVMLVAAGLSRWVVAGCAVLGAAGLPLVWERVLSGHQKARIIGLINPWRYADGVMYQQLQGRLAIGAGRVLGRGLFQPGHTFVPRPENDFIFSYYAESCGFVGCVVLLGLLFGLLFKVLAAAASAADRAGAYLCAGVFAALFTQIVISVGMNLMLLPVMGLTLPFFSAGGTSVVALYLLAGLVAGMPRRAAPPAGAGPGEDAGGDTGGAPRER